MSGFPGDRVAAGAGHGGFRCCLASAGTVISGDLFDDGLGVALEGRDAGQDLAFQEL